MKHCRPGVGSLCTGSGGSGGALFADSVVGIVEEDSSTGVLPSSVVILLISAASAY